MISHKQNSAMKTLSRIFLTAILFAITLVSCGKITPTGGDTPGGDIPGGNTEQEAGTRIITLSFNTKATRTELGEDYTPKFSDGDTIAVAKVTEQSDTQHCKVSVNPTTGIATTTTKFTEGELMAVYPAKYALVDDGKLTYMVPFNQTGLFKDANICTAIIQDGKNPTAEFENRTAVFTLKVSDDFDDFEYVDVRALDWIDGETGQRSEEAGVSYIQFDDEGYYSQIYVFGKDVDGICYISVLAEDVEEDGEPVPKVLLRDLNFDVYLGNYHGLMGGFSPKFLGNKYNEAVQAGAMYTGVEGHLHMYYSNPHWYEDGTFSFYWAAEDLVGPKGDFFMWGDVNGHHYDEDSEKWNFEEDETSGFATENLPTLSTTYEEGDVLRLEDDAAYQNWGGSWRMPIYSEIETLYGSGKTDLADSHSWCSYVEGVNPPKFGSSTGYYWTSEMGEGSQVKVFSYKLTNDTLDDPRINKSLPAYNGIHIRPLSGIIEVYESD